MSITETNYGMCHFSWLAWSRRRSAPETEHPVAHSPDQADEKTARIQQIRQAMLTGAAMTIDGIPGSWNPAGDTWTTDDPASGDALALARISDAEDGDVDGVARQVQDLCDHAARTQARIGMILVENDTSAFKRRRIELPNGEHQLRTVRPQFRRALKLLTEPRFRRFLTVHLDRTVRDPRDLEDLIDVIETSRPRIVVDSVTGSLRLASDSDITAARILCAVANQSSRDTARRVSRKKRQLAEEGHFQGGRRPYGFEPDGETIRKSEADVIARYHAVALSGVAVREITRDMNAAGHRNANGELWTGQSARTMLLRPRNAGLSVHRPVQDLPQSRYYTPDDVVGRLPGDPIVAEDDYWALVAKWTDPDRRTNVRGTAPVLLGSGTFRCHCGSVLRASPWHQTRKVPGSTEKETVVRKTYRCSAPGKGHVTVPAAELDALVEALIIERIQISKPADIIGEEAADSVDVAALNAEVAKHRERLIDIAADRDNDLITRAQMLEMTARRRSKIQVLEAQISAANADRHPVHRLINAPDVQAAWDELDFGEQRAVVRRLVNLTVRRVGSGSRLPIRERIEIT
ncbi:recombinase family protein [Rhizohabitans arisaemae]|uniref:recombinase family protein n=1 Tax=Rhizohabitans arisaemae TaxID=2720610 RepID=UPI0024B1B28A|nr:recombinase family protein [Rhizohabitans arisaemae]